MNRLSTERRAQILACLCEGNSIRATCRLTGAAKGTVLKLLVDVGGACARFHDERVVGLACEQVQCDEIWSFTYCKARNVPKAKITDATIGDTWTWKAICGATRLLISYHVGGRDVGDCRLFIEDLADRLDSFTQINTDGLAAYRYAIPEFFGLGNDHGIVIKAIMASGDRRGVESRYSPGEVVQVEKRTVWGRPDYDQISTSYVERSNLTLRMQQRRFTRLTNAFSKKLENLQHAVALHAVHYNFCKAHRSLKGKTPAQAMGLAKRRWTPRDIAALLD